MTFEAQLPEFLCLDVNRLFSSGDETEAGLKRKNFGDQVNARKTVILA
jgi:hypothetical protein